MQRRKIRRIRLALTLPFVLLFPNAFFTPVLAKASTTEVHIESRTSQISGWDRLNLGVAKIQVKHQKPYDVYVLTGAGLEDQLKPGEEPLAHLKRCLAGDYPARLSLSFTAAPLSRDNCLALLVLWGHFLVEGPLGNRLEPAEAEKNRGWLFLQIGFLQLSEDLRRLSGDSERLSLMLSVGRFDFGLRKLLLIFHPLDAVRAAALHYYLQVWDALPPLPATYDAFHLKFAAGERLKQLYGDVLANDTPPDPATARNAQRFYEQAYRFHQAPFPDRQRLNLPRIVPAGLRDAAVLDGVGYAIFPGDDQLRPLFILANTDLLASELLLRRMLAAHLISEAECRSADQSLAAEHNRLKLADTGRWVEAALKNHDIAQALELRAQQVALFRDLGDLDKAESLLEQICLQLYQQNDLSTWASRTVDLITYKIKREQWKAAFDLLQQVKPVLLDQLLTDKLDQALGYENLVRGKLGMPPVDTGPVEKALAGLKQPPDFDEPDRAKRLALLRAYASEPGLPPALKVAATIQIVNTLTDIGETAEAEQILIGLLPEIRHRRGVSGEIDALGSLLDLQAQRGEFGLFYSTLERYESVSRAINGDNWLRLGARRLAEVFFQLQDYHKAEAFLQAEREQYYIRTLLNPQSFETLEEGDPPAQIDDELLEARIQMELGKKDRALLVLAALDDRSVSPSPYKPLLLQLGDIYSALGQPKLGLERITRLLTLVKPLEDINLWAKATLQEAQLRLQMGEPLSEQVAKMEELIPHASQFHELEAVTAVNMDIFLADYYVAQNSPNMAMERLRRGLVSAEKFGAIDQQIIIHRKMGEIAASKNDAAAAAVEYRQSIALLKNVSRGIPSDLGKVGYRAVRNKAIPLLAVTLLQLFQQSHDVKYLNELAGVIEEGKSRALAEMLVTSAAGNQPVDIASIRGSLPAGAVLVEYYVPEGVSGQIIRLVIDHSSATLDILSLNSDQLSGRIAGMLGEITNPYDFNEPQFKLRAQEMGQVLLPPSCFAADRRFAPRRVFIVPVGILHLFPFELLVDEHGHYLAENESVELAYLPNASFLTKPVPRFQDASHSAGFVNPALDGDHHQALLEAGPLETSLADAFRRWSGGEIAWEKPLTAHQFLAQAATNDNVFLYSHGKFVPDDPTGSYVRFADERGDVPYLSAAQLLASKIGGGLWVLAACSSGVEKVRAGDEALGLPRALLESGAAMVVTSLWDVDAISSLDIMSRFYQNMTAGLPVAQALRNASAALRQSGKPPYDWAPFILMGRHGFNDGRQ